jgi:hypothetical protein
MPEIITSMSFHLQLVSAVLAILSLGFLIWFLFPALKRIYDFGRIKASLDSASGRDAKDPQALDVYFPKDGEIGHLWREYKKTLYSTTEDDGSGIAKTRWLATTPAEAVWNPQQAVDHHVRAEFFKHLPGLFTGIGIIGTFVGLIEGLKAFKVSSDADVVRGSLETLMHSVGEAFLVSATAIGLAMLVTFFEKWALSALYRGVDRIADSLDRRFPASVAEQFLEDTAAHTEEAATQLKHLKSELLRDLTPILRELSDKQAQTLERLTASLESRLEQVTQTQIGAAQENSKALGTTISDAIRGSLSEPLADIKSAVQQASGDQSAAAVKMLQDVMASFSQRLNDLFGGQISGINELNQRTANTMQEAVNKLNELVVSLQDAGRKSSESMAEQMAKALADMESRQAAMTQATQNMLEELRKAILASSQTTSDGLKSSAEEMTRRMAEAVEKMEQRQESINKTTREFVEQIKALVEGSQEKTGAKLQATLDALGEQLGKMLAEFQAVQQAGLDKAQERDAKVAETTEKAANEIQRSTEKFVDHTGKVLTESTENSRRILQSTMDSMRNQIGAMLKEFRDAQKEALEDGRKREAERSGKTQAAVDALTTAIDSLIQQISAASAKSSEAVELLSRTTSTAIGQLNDGAEQVNTATRNFSSATDKVSGVMNQTATVATRLSELSSSMGMAASSLQQGIQDYKAQRDAIGSLVTELKALVANAKTDVSLTSDVLRRIEAATKELSKAQLQTEQFMAGVAQVLATAHEKFRDEMLKTVRANNTEFHEKLSSAVGLLASSIQELEGFLSTATPKGRRS